MTLSYSQTRRSKWPRVKEIKQVEEMLAQRPAWDECQWCPVVLWFDFRRLGAETCWDYWFWIWAQRSPVFFRTSREDLEQTGLAQRKEEAPNFKSWSHGRVLTGRTPYMFVDWREELRGERKLKIRDTFDNLERNRYLLSTTSGGKKRMENHAAFGRWK